MNNALFGHTGLVGSTLLRQHAFAATYRSTTIGDCRGRRFDMAVCAAAPAQKWLANQKPVEDEAAIRQLIHHLSSIECHTFVLISTVDVFHMPDGVDEDTPVDESALAPYGKHRRFLELAISELFPRVIVVRLPGLVGPGLKKNVIFDLHNNHNIFAIDSRATFQFYPLVNLWPDIQTAIRAGLKCVHLTAEPLDVATVAARGFGRDFHNHVLSAPPSYDVQTRYASVYGRRGRYTYDVSESLLVIRAYAQSEPLRAEASR
jgi:hypothetical protein